MKIIRLLLAFSLTLLISGCLSTLGENFISPDSPKNNLATVYIYTKFTGRFDLYINNKLFIDMQSNSYYQIDLQPGNYEFSGKFFRVGNCNINKNLEYGKIYYIKIELTEVEASTATKILVGASKDLTPIIDFVNENTALIELKMCKKIIPSSSIKNNSYYINSNINDNTQPIAQTDDDINEHVNIENKSKNVNNIKNNNGNYSSSSENKLEQLKRVYENGLITKEEYDQKRKNILDTL